ncbi:unnamed protein product [Candida verbasci]|uniref:Large ribosomal subunit protein mL53 n=1 Tax=Candida verbasci TaxID=1227364 RepID=A0A9W4X867_9ASCO|nr:unnamed protein product [Candida verbasci]
MITKYFQSVNVKFNPFQSNNKASRLFLAKIPSTSKIEYKVLNSSDSKPEVKVTFKDKHSIIVDPTNMKLIDLEERFDSHSRKLAIKDAIEN